MVDWFHDHLVRWVLGSIVGVSCSYGVSFSCDELFQEVSSERPPTFVHTRSRLPGGSFWSRGGVPSDSIIRSLGSSQIVLSEAVGVSKIHQVVLKDHSKVFRANAEATKGSGSLDQLRVKMIKLSRSGEQIGGFERVVENPFQNELFHPFTTGDRRAVFIGFAGEGELRVWDIERGEDIQVSGVPKDALGDGRWGEFVPVMQPFTSSDRMTQKLLLVTEYSELQVGKGRRQSARRDYRFFSLDLSKDKLSLKPVFEDPTRGATQMSGFNVFSHKGGWHVAYFHAGKQQDGGVLKILRIDPQTDRATLMYQKEVSLPLESPIRGLKIRSDPGLGENQVEVDLLLRPDVLGNMGTMVVPIELP